MQDSQDALEIYRLKEYRLMQVVCATMIIIVTSAIATLWSPLAFIVIFFFKLTPPPIFTLVIVSAALFTASVIAQAIILIVDRKYDTWRYAKLTGGVLLLLAMIGIMFSSASYFESNLTDKGLDLSIYTGLALSMHIFLWFVIYLRPKISRYNHLMSNKNSVDLQASRAKEYYSSKIRTVAIVWSSSVLLPIVIMAVLQLDSKQLASSTAIVVMGAIQILCPIIILCLIIRKNTIK